MCSVFLTVLTGRRPELLQRTLESIKDVVDRCTFSSAIVWDPEDDESKGLLRAAGIGPPQHFQKRLKNGPAVSACARDFLGSDYDVWLHIEDDWELLPDRAALEPDWFEVASELATNQDIGQVRLREIEHLGGLVPVQYPEGVRFLGDGSGCANRNWVSSKYVEWRTEPEWPFMVSADSNNTSPAHATFNPCMWNRKLVEQVFWSPVRDELQAMDRMHAARTEAGGRFATAQLRPGVFRHIGEGQSLEGH